MLSQQSHYLLRPPTSLLTTPAALSLSLAKHFIPLSPLSPLSVPHLSRCKSLHSTTRVTMVVQVWEILTACVNARNVYLRILFRPTMRIVSHNAIFLLVWLETTMGFEVLANMASMAPDDTLLTHLVYEADALYTYVLLGYYVSLPSPGFQTIIAFCDEGRLIDEKFFIFHRDLINMIRDNLGMFLFNDNLYAMLRRFQEDSNSFLIRNLVLDPELMAPFVVTARTMPEDSRTTFVALPECHPLSFEDIKDNFERYVYVCVNLASQKVRLDKP